jgi:hypothetical protein
VWESRRDFQGVGPGRPCTTRGHCQILGVNEVDKPHLPRRTDSGRNEHDAERLGTQGTGDARRGSAAGDGGGLLPGPDARGRGESLRSSLRRALTRAGESAQWLSPAGLGHTGGHPGAGDPEAQGGQLLSRLADRAAPAGGEGPGLGRGRVLRARRVHPSGGGPGPDAGDRAAIEVPGLGDGEEPG